MSAFFLVHILRDWAADPMIQADQLAELGNLWMVAILASLLVGRLRTAKAEIARRHGLDLRRAPAEGVFRSRETTIDAPGGVLPADGSRLRATAADDRGGKS